MRLERWRELYWKTCHISVVHLCLLCCRRCSTGTGCHPHVKAGSYLWLQEQKTHSKTLVMSCMGACAEAVPSSIHLMVMLRRSSLGKPPSRLQPCAKLPAVSVYLLQPAGLWPFSQSPLLSRILQGKRSDKPGEHCWNEPYDQAGAVGTHVWYK